MARDLSGGDALTETLLKSTFSIVDFCIAIIGPVLVIAASGMLGYVVFTFFAYTLPFYTSAFSALWWTLTTISLTFLFFVLYNYYNAVFTHPGCPPLSLPESVISECIEIQNLVEGEERKRSKGKKKSRAVAPDIGQAGMDYCKLCDAPKPPRTHHCHVTNRCVLLMDHFCPWVANTVGFRNYRFFYLFMMWMWLGSIYVTVLMYPAFTFATSNRHMPGRSGITFAFVCALALFFALGGMLGWQTYLLATAQTTIEFYHNRSKLRHARLEGSLYRNPFDLGLAKNWETIFGPSKFPFHWALPFHTGPTGNGVQWPTITNPNPTYEELDTTNSTPTPTQSDHVPNTSTNTSTTVSATTGARKRPEPV